MQTLMFFRTSSGAMLLLSTLFMILGTSLGDASDSGTFFLKAAKNVPRIGRRSGGGDNTFFLKATKNVPRIGRRGSPWGAGAGLTEMRDNGGWPWFRNADNPIPSRSMRTGPTSLAGLWDGPSRLPARTQYIKNNYNRAPVNAAEDTVPLWHSLSDEEEGEISNPMLRYDLEDDEDTDVSASQLLAPPATQFQRLPFEGAFPRQRRDEQTGK